jgi:phage baseplate assembly protein W
MRGMNALTGRSVDGIDHLHQSVAQILTTPLGTRIKRRAFGSNVPDLIDAPNNGATRTRLYAAIATALMRWEPRLTLTRVLLSSEATDAGQGAQIIEVEGATTSTGQPFSTRVRLPNGEVQ